MREVVWSRSALRTMRALPANLARRIRSKVDQYAAEPGTLANNVTAMKGSPYVRLRVGDWRVILDDQGRVLQVVKVGPRGGVYD